MLKLAILVCTSLAVASTDASPLHLQQLQQLFYASSPFAQTNYDGNSYNEQLLQQQQQYNGYFAHNQPAQQIYKSVAYGSAPSAVLYSTAATQGAVQALSVHPSPQQYQRQQQYQSQLPHTSYGVPTTPYYALKYLNNNEY
ncbi:hypothetical protein TKK_0007104 [Trichogramma kaykai]